MNTFIPADWKLPELAFDNNNLNKSYFESGAYKTNVAYYKLKGALEYILNNDSNNLSLLDVGCGSGWHGVYLKKENINISYNGTDLSQHMCDNAKENCPDSNFIVLDITTSVPKNKYDIVMESAVLELVSSWRLSMANMLLTANKWFVAHRLFFTNKETKTEYVETYRKIKDIRTHIGMNDFNDVLLECGFELVNKDVWETSAYNMGTFIARRK